jgi:hypothetical protein
VGRQATLLNSCVVCSRRILLFVKHSQYAFQKYICALCTRMRTRHFLGYCVQSTPLKRLDPRARFDEEGAKPACSVPAAWMLTEKESTAAARFAATGCTTSDDGSTPPLLFPHSEGQVDVGRHATLHGNCVVSPCRILLVAKRSDAFSHSLQTMRNASSRRMMMTIHRLAFLTVVVLIVIVIVL